MNFEAASCTTRTKWGVDNSQFAAEHTDAVWIDRSAAAGRPNAPPCAAPPAQCSRTPVPPPPPASIADEGGGDGDDVTCGGGRPPPPAAAQLLGSYACGVLSALLGWSAVQRLRTKSVARPVITQRAVELEATPGVRPPERVV